jgi:hypothetical protein
MREYLTFKKLITPALIQVVFWIAIVGNTIEALFYADGFLNGLLLFIIGPILIRIFCEGLIVVFEISNTLTEIRDNQLRPPPVTAETIPPASTL